MKREELIAYDKWLTRRKWGTGEIISPEKAADLYLADHPLPPAECARKVQWSGYGELGNISQKPLQPTAEGADEITAEEFIREKIRQKGEIKGEMMGLWTYRCSGEDALRWAYEFATLHAQRLAEKMVEERLREQ